ncbi:MAG: hypothetical protein ACLTC4_06105 [Hungatella hathewayi]|uniref:Uncharacterized protein n=1 Tax=Hungatella hathewayi WAL-18680 TaxID=742737 RepID=G5IF76_9FIRM|nr:hypothetical protein [Hungatella hathewayi]EHI59822.1 hypothetical protein HMPREF9473_02153 [ [Hungatella hathewayi WAL-18680]
MLFYEQKEKEILDMLKKFQENKITIVELQEFRDRLDEEIIESDKKVHHDDTYNFLRVEKYWMLLVNVINNKIDKNIINSFICAVKADDFIAKVQFKHPDTTKKAEKIDKPLLYFDFNTYIVLKKKVPINSVTDKYQFVYSPAHLEELANSIRKNDFVYNESIENDLKYLSCLTNNMEFLPDIDEGIKICFESPYFPLKRVIEEYGGTIISEELEKNFLENRQPIRAEQRVKVRGSDISGVLSTPEAEKLMDKYTWYHKYKDIGDKEKFWNEYKSNYNFLFNSIVELVNVIEILDNNPEPSKKYRSHLHDTTHLIYATKSDIFVTHDNRLFNKANEIYSFLGVNTEIVRQEVLMDLMG